MDLDSIEAMMRRKERERQEDEDMAELLEENV